MPGYNGTGPVGNGPMSGHGGGYCLVDRDEMDLNNGAGMGNGNRGNRMRSGRKSGRMARRGGWAGPGFRAGRRRRNRGIVPRGWCLTDEKEFLKNQAKVLKSKLDNLNKRIEELEEEAKDTNNKNKKAQGE